ncbi:MAG TPA: hypothetical protein VHE53_02170 [Patescibacteria group bacterium]|nr:hypothetical protein [Patescibacteria group bacterium]
MTESYDYLKSTGIIKSIRSEAPKVVNHDNPNTRRSPLQSAYETAKDLMEINQTNVEISGNPDGTISVRPVGEKVDSPSIVLGQPNVPNNKR